MPCAAGYDANGRTSSLMILKASDGKVVASYGCSSVAISWKMQPSAHTSEGWP